MKCSSSTKELEASVNEWIMRQKMVKKTSREEEEDAVVDPVAVAAAVDDDGNAEVDASFSDDFAIVASPRLMRQARDDLRS